MAKSEALLAGPFLYADSSDASTWTFSLGALLKAGSAANPGATVVASHSSGLPVTIDQPVLVDDLTKVGMGTFWRWRLSVQRSAKAETLDYELRLPGETTAAVNGVRIPSAGQLPNVAFFSCNGVSSEKLFHKTENLDALWEEMLERHASTDESAPTKGNGYHLLVGGGDQLYADSLWSTNRRLKAIKELPLDQRIAARAPPELDEELLADFVQLYVQRWGRTAPAKALATIPGVFTWDDHDIMDGWGSHPPALQTSPYYRALYKAAARCFETFQLGGLDRGPAVAKAGSTNAGHYLQSLSFSTSTADVELLLLDLRSQRTWKQVLGGSQWESLKAHLAAKVQPDPAGKPRHLVVVSSVPAVYMKFGGAEGLLGRIPGQQEIEDDLRDHWESPLHLGERSRLLMNLLQYAKDSRSRVTILSGDVHVGARGRVLSQRPEHMIEGAPQAIDQIVASGIGHPPPGWLEWQAVLLTGSEAKGTVAEGVTTDLLDISSGLRFLRMRNWLSIAFDAVSSANQSSSRMWMQWITEEGAVEPQVVVEARP